MKKTILVTGAAGYIGSMLCTELLNFNYKIIAIDLLKFTSEPINHLFSNKNFKFIKGDVRDKSLIKKFIHKANIIIPLAGLVGAPLCEKYKKEAKEVNYLSILNLLQLVKKNQRIIYPTTNSGYGIGQKSKYCDENTPLNPISLYGLTKCQSEEEIMKNKNAISFRLATVFGSSFRMRTDLLINNFVYEAVHKNKLIIFEPNFRRNFIHIRDVIKAFIFAINNHQILKGNIYNLGLSSANISKIMLAQEIKKQIPKLKISINNNQNDPDKRDYFVSNKKIEKAGFKAKISVSDGINELIQIYKYNKNKIYQNNY